MDRSQLAEKSKTVKIHSLFSSKNSSKNNSLSNLVGNSVDRGNDSFIEVFRSYQIPNTASQKNDKTKNDGRFIHPQNTSDVTAETLQSKKDNLSCLLVNQPTSSAVERKTELSRVLKDNAAQNCPICLKKNTFDEASLFISHMKSCAAKNEVSTEQLMKAIQLTEKQTSERLALGLPNVAFEKNAMKKIYPRKMGMDSSLQLAMALSVSLRESEMLTKMKETETLLEAGLEEEAMSQCRQLEDFGFMSSKPVQNKIQKNATRSKCRQNTVLFTRSQTERERIITEKIAIVLIDSDRPYSDLTPSFNTCAYKSNSKFLQNLRDKDSRLWRKSHELDEEVADEYYYVRNLSTFISPCHVEVGAQLKHVSQIPGRRSAPDDDHFHPYLQDLIDFFESSSTKNRVKVISKMPVKMSRPAVEKSTSRLALDWKLLVNNRFMSDITIYVKHERTIYAHKLVLYARCNSILADTIKETENNRTTEMITWLEFSNESVIAFLEYVYADAVDLVKKLDKDQLSNLTKLCVRYNVNELREYIDQMTVASERFTSNISEKAECSDDVPFSSENHSPVKNDVGETIFDAEEPYDDGEKNLLFLQTALITQHENDPASPEMFEDSDAPLIVEENAEDDFSLSICDSSPTDCILESCLAGKNPFTASPLDTEAINGNQKQCNEDPKIVGKFFSSPKRTSFEVKVEEQTPTKKHGSVQWTCDTDVICLSDDDDLCDTPFNADNMKSDCPLSQKRKSASPLVKSPAKKEKTTKLKERFPRQSNVERKTAQRRHRKKQLSSQSYSLNDSLESSDSDESLYKISRANERTSNICPADTVPVNGASPCSRIPVTDTCVKVSPSVRKIDDCDTSFELDDFRDMEPEIRKISDGEHEPGGKYCSPLSPEKSIADGIADGEKGTIDVPYVSPIWDGFEEANNDYFVMNFPLSPSRASNTPISKISTPMKDLLTKNLSSALELRNICENSIDLDESPSRVSDAKRVASDVPSFESFSVDESVLSKLENKGKLSKTPVAHSQIVTPTNVRKLKVRSRSDTFLTPSPRSNCNVTPLADYSGMKTCDLKKELDKYGIKPGLGRKQAKQLLRHIYSELHPLGEETDPKKRADLKEKQKLKGNCQKKKRTNLDGGERKSADASYDSDKSSDSFSSGIDVLETSFVEEDLNQDQDPAEDSKSQKITLEVGFKSLLRTDKELHTKILLYEPIWLEALKKRLKEKDVRCSSLNLMNYLDEKCITFRTQQQRRVHKKRRKNDAVESSQSL